jgi:prophage maintenance system killer protein
MEKSEIIIYKTKDGEGKIDVQLTEDTVWLNRQQLSELYNRDVKTIGKHISNALKEELQDIPTVAKFATVQIEGGRNVTRNVEYYNLDMIISIGYRVKSTEGILFRRWANNVLKDYDVIEQYSKALDLLDDYDHQVVSKPQGDKSTYVLSYDECIDLISKMKFGAESNIFGNEKDDSFKSSISTIYQTFDGIELYPSIQEKAANLLYLIVKNHSFSDGNKRIAAAMFIYFLKQNNLLYANEQKVIADDTLVAITIMIAESKPAEKDIMVNLVMNFLV